MIREKLLAVLPGQFTEEVSGDDPKESDEHQYCVQDTDTGEIPGRRKPEVSRATCFVPGLAGT